MSSPQAAPRKIGGILRHIGPGLIITASIVGSGELIATPAVASDPETGFKLLWFIIMGCIVKVFVQIELGRYALATGQTTIEAMDTVPGPRLRVSWLVWAWLLMFICLPFQVAGMYGGMAKMVTLARAGGGATAEQLTAFRSQEWMWVVLVGIATGGLLVSGRYRLVQNLCTLMVAAFTAFTMSALVTVQSTPFRITGENIMEGLSFQMPSTFTVAFAAFGIIGVGASELIYYPFWCLEKGYAVHVGPRDGTPGWLERARAWVKVMSVDAWLSLVIYTAATVGFYLLGAAVLHGQGIVIRDDTGKVIDHLSEMYTRAYGQKGLLMFLLGGMCVLYSTIFAATASNARLLVNGLKVFKLHSGGDAARRDRDIKFACVGLALFSMAIYLSVEKVVFLVLVGGVAQGILLPFLAGAALYFRLKRHRDVAENPARPWQFPLGTLFLVLSVISMSAVGIYMAFKELTR